MKISKVSFYTLIVAFCSSMIAQKTDGKLSIRLRVGGNAVSVKDKDLRSSRDFYPADGNTSKKSGETNSFVTLGANYDFGGGSFKFSPGLWITGTNVSLTNYDYDNGAAGRYDSKYNISYLQIPLLLKYTSEKELADNLTWYISFGPQVGLKVKESLYEKKGYGDYAHFWNMAKQRTWLDGQRGRNGNFKTMGLFSPFNASFMINPGVEYKVNDKATLFGGLTIDLGITNLINYNLRFFDPNDIDHNHDNAVNYYVSDLLKVRSNFIGLDLGIRF